MAEDQVAKLIELVTTMSERIVRLETQFEGLNTRIDKYNNITGRTSTLESKMMLVESHVESAHDEAKRSKISWGTVMGSIISAVTVGLIMLTINFAIK